MLIDDILNTYYEYRNMIFEKYETPKHMQVVLRMTPKAFIEIRSNKELRIFNNYEFFYIELLGRKTPIIIENDLPENVEFIIQSQKDYERQEQQKLFNKFYRMFDEY